MADIRTRRAVKDFQRFTAALPETVLSAELVKGDLYRWHLVLVPPKESIFAGGKFHVLMTLPEGYPHKAPHFLVQTKIFNPAVSATGEVCEGLLSNWTPDQNAVDAVASLSKGIFTDFGNVDSLNSDARREYDENPAQFREIVRHYVRQYASA